MPLLAMPLATTLVDGTALRAGGEVRTVARITDGDTLVLQDGRRVRLVQIDAPEVGGGECFSRAAKRRLAALVPPGSNVRLERDPGLDDVDRYGRLLRYVTRNGINVNLRLVANGSAAPYSPPSLPPTSSHLHPLSAAAAGRATAERRRLRPELHGRVRPDRPVRPRLRRPRRSGACGRRRHPPLRRRRRRLRLRGQRVTIAWKKWARCAVVRS